MGPGIQSHKPLGHISDLIQSILILALKGVWPFHNAKCIQSNFESPWGLNNPAPVPEFQISAQTKG